MNPEDNYGRLIDFLSQISKLSYFNVLDLAMGAIWWGTRGACPTHFSRWGDRICHVPPFFLFRFCFWRGSQNKIDVCHVLREVPFMLDVTQRQVDVETVFQVSLDTCVVSPSVISLDSVCLSILASIKWYLAFFKFLETAKIVYCFCPTFYPVQYTVRKVIFLKQW